MHLLFLFLDGIGLGTDDPSSNPFARAHLPNMHALLGGRLLVAGITPYHSERASLLSLDTCLGVDGVPQSATGQAVLLTGTNIPAALGYHYGPKPNPAVAEFLRNGQLFDLADRPDHHYSYPAAAENQLSALYPAQPPIVCARPARQLIDLFAVDR